MNNVQPAAHTFKFFLTSLPRNIAAAFRGWNLAWHALAIALTAALVLSGFDWWYFEHARRVPWAIVLPPIMLGTFAPVLVPLGLLLIGQSLQRARIKTLGYLLGQAALLGSLISSAYKAFTGRIQPPMGNPMAHDISHAFQFGFLRHGIFWGWPSSHTTIAFAMAVALVTILPRNRPVRIVALLYAFGIGLAVTAGIHWFSEFVAGAIIGTVIGVVVGKAYAARSPSPAVMEGDTAVSRDA